MLEIFMHEGKNMPPEVEAGVKKLQEKIKMLLEDIKKLGAQIVRMMTASTDKVKGDARTSNQNLLAQVFELGNTKVAEGGNVVVSLRNGEEYRGWDIVGVGEQHGWTLAQRLPVPLQELKDHGYSTVTTVNPTKPVKGRHAHSQGDATLYVFERRIVSVA
jgi:hypothetical protein